MFDDSIICTILVSGATNQIIDVQFDYSTSTVICKVLNFSSGMDTSNTCKIAYGPVPDSTSTICTIRYHSEPTPLIDGIAKLELSSLQDSMVYCFVVTASNNGMDIAVIEGNFTSTQVYCFK